MAINKISQEKINQIKQKSVITLPNQPKISAEELKARFVKPIADTSNSMIQELDRIVEETNAELDGIDDTLQNHESRIGELELFAENLETNITEEIEDALDNKADLVDGKVPLEQLPDVEDVLTGDITSHNHTTEIGNHNTSETAHTDIRNAVAEAKVIAEGKSRAIVFATEADLNGWLATPPTFSRPDGKTKADLKIGDNLYIEETDKPDYWWNGTTIVELETQKVDLTEYAKKTELLTLGTTENDAYRGDLGQIAYNHSQSAHAPSNAQKNSDITKAEIEAKLTGEISSHSHALPNHDHDDRYYTETEVDTKLVGKANATHNHTKSEITDFPTIPTIPNISITNGTAEIGKYISQVAVDATDKHKLVITKADLPQGFSGNYNDLTNKPTIPTVPTISTNIATDATSDAKTASPKAVKTYVDNAISTALDNLLGGEY